MIDKEEGNGPAFKKPIEMGRRHESQPNDGGCHNDQLMKDCRLVTRVFVEGVKARGGERGGGNVGPEDPREAEVGPEEGAEEGGGGGFGGGEGEGEDEGVLADGERGDLGEGDGGERVG